VDSDLAEAVIPDWRDAEVPHRLRAVFEYAAKLTNSPADVGREDIERLREAGLDDRGILDVAQIVSYFNFVNRMAEGLGVELEG
jgi:uncharacterized peroxidase-related enzyme